MTNIEPGAGRVSRSEVEIGGLYSEAVSGLPTWDFDRAEGLEGHVYQALGGASVCWESMSGTGMFQDDQARTIARKLIRWIEQNYVRADTEKRYKLTDGAASAARNTIQTAEPAVLYAVGADEGVIVLDLDPTINPAEPGMTPMQALVLMDESFGGRDWVYRAPETMSPYLQSIQALALMAGRGAGLPPTIPTSHAFMLDNDTIESIHDNDPREFLGDHSLVITHIEGENPPTAILRLDNIDKEN